MTKLTYRGVGQVDVPEETIRQACDRAVAYRRQQLADVAATMDLPVTIATSPLPIIEGWVRAGVIHDPVSAMALAILYHPETNRVRVERPPAWPHLPLRLRDRPFAADPGYVYLKDGVEYDADAAELMTAIDGSLVGWTWRRIE